MGQTAAAAQGEPFPHFRPLQPEDLDDAADAQPAGWAHKAGDWAAASAACPACGAVDQEPARFCRQCGAALGGAALGEAEPLALPSAARGRRRGGPILILGLTGLVAVGLAAGGWWGMNQVSAPATPARSVASRPAPAPPVVAARPPPPARAAPLSPEPEPAAAPAPAVLGMITDPVWVRRPSSHDVYEYYPIQAQNLDLAGEATIDCAVAAKGRLTGCRVISESPRGMGFGRSTLELSRDLQVRATTRSGEPTAGRRLRVPIRWRLNG